MTHFEYVDQSLSPGGDPDAGGVVVSRLIEQWQSLSDLAQSHSPNVAVIRGPGAERDLSSFARTLERAKARVLWIDCPSKCRWPFGVAVLQLMAELLVDLSADAEAQSIVRGVAGVISPLFPAMIRSWSVDGAERDVTAHVADNHLKTIENTSYVEDVLDELATAVRRLLVLESVRSQAPTAVVVANVQWIDRPTFRLLSRLIRTLCSDPVLICTHADGQDPEHRIGRFLDQLVQSRLGLAYESIDVGSRNRVEDTLQRVDSVSLECMQILAVADIPLPRSVLSESIQAIGAGAGSPDPSLLRIQRLLELSDSHERSNRLMYLSAAWKRKVTAAGISAEIRSAALRARRHALSNSDMKWCHRMEGAIEANADGHGAEVSIFLIGFNSFEKFGETASAARFYSDLTSHTPDDYRLHAKLAAIRVILGERRIALEHYRDALERCFESFDRCFLACQAAVNAVKCQRVTEAKALIDTARTALSAITAGDHRHYLTARVLNARSYIAFSENHFAEAVALLTEACTALQRTAQESPHRNYEYVLHRNRARVEQASGALPSEYVRRYRRALALCRGAGQQLNRSELLFALGRAYLSAHDTASADVFFRRLLRRSRSDLRLSTPALCRRIIGMYRATGCAREALRWQLTLFRYYLSQNRLYDAAAHVSKLASEGSPPSKRALQTFLLHRLIDALHQRRQLGSTSLRAAHNLTPSREVDVAGRFASCIVPCSAGGFHRA